MGNDFELEQISVRLVKDSPLYSDERIITAESAVKIIGKELMTQLDREQLCIVNLNSFGQPINFSIVYVGQIESKRNAKGINPVKCSQCHSNP